MDLNKKNDESELQYIWRVCLAKDSGSLDMTWEELTEVLNSNLREDDEYLSSSAYRKKFQQAKAFYDEVFCEMGNKEYVDELNESKRELERLKIQFRDERNAWNRQNYSAARIDENLNILENKLSNIGKIEFADYSSIDLTSDNDIVVCASDWHIGETFNSPFGEYNSDIAKQRIDKLIQETVRIANINHSEKVYVCLLGDEVSGNIHLSIQVTNRENIIEQIQLSAELITNFVVELSRYFSKVFVIGVAGNHSRLIANKEKDIKDERLDTLITWIVEKMTSHIPSITVLHRNIDNGIFDINVRGKTYIGVHGDYDGMNQNSIGKLCMMLGFFPDYVIGGHRHTPAYQEFNGVKYIQSGSLAGSGDDYTVSKRLSGKPSQTILVCNNKGVDAIYNVEV